MTFDDMLEAIDAAKTNQRIVDNSVQAMAKLIANRLRASGSMDWQTRDAFKALKKELAGFDSRTGRWREQS